MMMSALNDWAVLGAAIAAMIIGLLWYSPMLFGTKWMKLSRVDPKASKDTSAMWSAMLGMFVGSLIMAYILANVLILMSITTVSLALIAALWLWLGFIVVPFSSAVLFERRPVALFFINIGNYLVTLLAMAAILVIW